MRRREGKWGGLGLETLQVVLRKILSNTRPLDTGANASTEEAEEGAEDADRKVIDIVESFRLQETFYDKKSLKQYLNGTYRVDSLTILSPCSARLASQPFHTKTPTTDSGCFLGVA